MSQTATQRPYRATFILDIRNYKEPVETMIEKIKENVAAVEGSVEEVINQGQKDFVRVTDRRQPNGIYVQVDFTGPSSAPAALNEKFRLDRAVDRILIQARD